MPVEEHRTGFDNPRFNGSGPFLQEIFKEHLAGSGTWVRPHRHRPVLGSTYRSGCRGHACWVQMGVVLSSLKRGRRLGNKMLTVLGEPDGCRAPSTPLATSPGLPGCPTPRLYCSKREGDDMDFEASGLAGPRESASPPTLAGVRRAGSDFGRTTVLRRRRHPDGRDRTADTTSMTFRRPNAECRCRA